MCGQTQMTEMAHDEPAWPPDAAMVLTALETGGWKEERRWGLRTAYRVRATLWLFADAPAAAARILYTRDANHRGIGFITRQRLPLGYGGILRLASPKSAKILNIACTLYRCRLAAPGWYEGALHFNRDQAEFFVGEEKPDGEE